MGSEHYCLRWNNHQSNLLGVFSQLLQDESLVDVTLACSEGASIRAHKVVLSACSSYFQTLFLDHPARHPIVILKDVRFEELRTLVDFMYKGEVNVEYCQLSALLKTAESLKVKGLAEMTNQNTALVEPKREPDRLRPHSHSSAHATSTAAAAASATAATSLTSASSPSAAPAACSAGSTAAVSPHQHHHLHQQQQQQHPSLGSPTSNAATAAAVAAAAASLGITDLSTIGKSRSLDPDGRSPSPTRLDPASPTPIALYPPVRKNRDHTHTSSTSVSSSAATTITTDAPERTLEDQEMVDAPRPVSRTGNVFSSSLNANSLNSTSKGLSESGSSRVNDSGNRRKPADDEEEEDDDDEEACNALSHDPPTHLDSEQEQLLQRIQRSSVDDEKRRRNSTTANSNNNNNTSNNNNNNSDDEYEPPIKIKSEIEFSPLSGLNMTINSPACLANSTTSGLVNSAASSLLSEMRPSSRDSGGGRGGGTPVTCTSTTVLNSAGGGGGGSVIGAMGGGNGSILGLDRSSPRSQQDRRERNAFSSGIPSPLQEPIAGPSGMGPVQQVPLSLKKEIDWDRGDDKSSGDSSLDFRHPHDSEPSEPHAASGSNVVGGGLCPSGLGGPPLGLGSGGVGGSGGGGGGSSRGGTPDQLLGGGGSIYPCMYCGTTFPHQSKLTRHILNHSLDTLKYREAPHMIHPTQLALLQQQHHELTQQAQHQHAAQAAAAVAAASIIQSSPSPSQLTSPHFAPHRSGPSLEHMLEGSDVASPMELEFAAAVAAQAAAAASGNAAAADQGNVVLCKFCGKSFPDVSSLITHLPVHTGDRPFKCEYCGKAFKLRHHMKDHCRVHTGERPFRCGMCGKTFSRSTILKAHEKTHYPKYVRKFLSPSPIDTKEEPPQ